MKILSEFLEVRIESIRVYLNSAERITLRFAQKAQVESLTGTRSMVWKIHNIEKDRNGKVRRRDIVPGPGLRGGNIPSIHGVPITVRRKEGMLRGGFGVAPSRSLRGAKKVHMFRIERFFGTRTRTRKDYESRIRRSQEEGL
jgi:hypothetical protein